DKGGRRADAGQKWPKRVSMSSAADRRPGSSSTCASLLAVIAHDEASVVSSTDQGRRKSARGHLGWQRGRLGWQRGHLGWHLTPSSINTKRSAISTSIVSMVSFAASSSCAAT
ncbi:MAG: hypothetical protein WBQ45_13930, partial [Roseiarcus sp.]